MKTSTYWGCTTEFQRQNIPVKKCNIIYPADKDFCSLLKFTCSTNNVLPIQRVFLKVKDTLTHTHTCSVLVKLWT